MVRSMRCAWVLLLAAGAAAADNRVQDPGSPWPTTVEPPRAAAMGGAHAAIATGNDAMSVNPAGLGQVRRYHLEVDGLYDAKFHTPEGLVQKFVQDVGFLSRRGNFSWAAVVQNLSIDKVPLFPILATAAIAWGTDSDWHLAFDYKADFSDTSSIKSRLAGGVEILLADAIALRGGATWDASAQQWWLSAGVGLLSEKGGIQLVWRRRIEGPYDQFFQAGLTVYLQ